jgi:hypothetical protein
MNLMHISEDANIKEFIPRKSESFPELPPVVWALDENHIVNYLFPRDCPRIIYSYTSDINEEDKEKFFSASTAKTIITVENIWYKRINETKIFKYIFKNNGFEIFDKIAGYYISKNNIKPIKIEVVENLIERILEKGIELIFTPNLNPLKNSIITSSIKKYSIIRFRNARK